MARNRFVNPKNGDFYDWPINHSEESEFGKSRNIEHGATTGNTGFVKQQSDDSPLTLGLRGTILTRAQHVAMIEWWDLSENQTIYFYDFAGDKYEVIITAYLPTRQRTVRNPQDVDNAEYWYWKYELKMEVIRILDGVWEGVTP